MDVFAKLDHILYLHDYQTIKINYYDLWVAKIKYFYSRSCDKNGLTHKLRFLTLCMHISGPSLLIESINSMIL